MQVISSFAQHYKTGEPLNETVIKDMCAAKRLFQACVSIQSRSDIDGVRMLKDSYIRNKVEENLDHCHCLLQMFKNKKKIKKS